MNNEKKKNTITYTVFVIAVALSTLLGFGFGMIMVFVQMGAEKIDWPFVAYKSLYPAGIAFLVFEIVINAYGFAKYIKAKKEYKEIENADDEVFETRIIEVEKKLKSSILAGSTEFIVSLMLYSTVIFLEMIAKDAGYVVSGIATWGNMVCFLASIVCFMANGALVVNLEKKINPEKKGNVFDFSFRKKWFESMDEGELLEAARGAQKAYTAGMYAGLALWLVSFFFMMINHSGILAVVCITIMMLIMSLVGGLSKK